MSVYGELLTRALRAYEDASNGFRPADAARKVREAAAGLRAPLEQLAGEIRARRAGLYADAREFEAEATRELLLLDADHRLLGAARESAARADRAKAAGIVVDQSLAVRRIKAQWKADEALLRETGGIIQQARLDAKSAAELPPPDSPPGGIEAIDVKALERSIAERAMPEVDEIVVRQIRQLGGQAVGV
ncbi:MAG: hypothetical protein ACREHE_07170 [Rhizomicrobium sp.]